MAVVSTRGLVIAAVLILFLCGFSAERVRSQVEWLKDASSATIPDGPVTGRINGKTAVLKLGWLTKSGHIEFGSPDAAFDHYTISLRDSDNFIESIFSVDLTVTVRRGERPDGKIFRAIQTASVADKPSIRGPGYSVPEFYSLRMESRRGKDLGSGIDLISEPGSLFSGRVEMGKRAGEKITTRIYVCFDDKLKSCVAGTAQVEVR